MTADVDLEARIAGLVKEHLNLEDNGEMMMPLKRHEITSLSWAIHDLVQAACESAR